MLGSILYWESTISLIITFVSKVLWIIFSYFFIRNAIKKDQPKLWNSLKYFLIIFLLPTLWFPVIEWRHAIFSTINQYWFLPHFKQLTISHFIPILISILLFTIFLIYKHSFKFNYLLKFVIGLLVGFICSWIIMLISEIILKRILLLNPEYKAHVDKITEYIKLIESRKI